MAMEKSTETWVKINDRTSILSLHQPFTSGDRLIFSSSTWKWNPRPPPKMSLNLLNEYHEIVLHMCFIAQDDRLVLNDRPLLDHWRDEVQVPNLKNNLFGGDFEISVLDLADEYRVLAGNREMHTFVKRGIAGPVVAVAHQRSNYDQSGLCYEFNVEMRKRIETGQNIVHAELSPKEKINHEQPSRYARDLGS